MNPYQPLVNLTGRVDFVDNHLTACAQGAATRRGFPLLLKLRTLLALDDATNDAQARLVYATLRLVAPVLKETFGDIHPLPAIGRVPPVFQITGAEADPVSVNVTITSKHRRVVLTFNDAHSAVLTGGTDSAVVDVREANGFLDVNWPEWCKVTGLLRLVDQTWELGCRVEITSPCSVDSLTQLADRITQWPELHLVLRESNLADFFNGAANPAYKVGYAAAALVLLIENS